MGVAGASLEKFEATPLVVDGVLYTVQAPNDVVALDAATGRIFWTFSYKPSADARPCCGRVNRGLAILGDTLFMGTIDAHLLAIDAKSGELRLEHRRSRARRERYAITHAPLVVKDKVIVGTAGGDFGIRGFIAAFDAKTGKEVWRFYTIPGAGEPGNDTWAGDSWKNGGAAVWNAGAYDPRDEPRRSAAPAIPAPDWDGDARGDNLYSDSVRRARRRHGQAEVALPVHAARRDRLRLDAGARARRHRVAGRAAQGDAVGQPQRRHVRARPRHGRVPARQAVRRR